MMHVIYTGERVRLRPFRDWDEYLELLRENYDEPAQFWPAKRCPVERKRKWFTETGGLDERRGEFAIERLDSGRLIGNLSHSTYRPALCANIGTLIRVEHRYRGYGVESKQLMMCYLFENFPMLRVEATTLVHHRRARRGVELAGMSLESVSGRRRWSRGKLAGWLTYRIFREQWEQLPIRQVVRRGA
jgi:RimJ/RimL family protein N-acetyltransferase